MSLSRRLFSAPFWTLFLSTTLAVSAQTGQPESKEPATTERAPAPAKEAPEVDNEELCLNLYGDVGGFGVGSDFSWRAQAIFGYSVSDSVALNLGYAALGARNEQGVGADFLKFKFTNYGPVVGATFKL